MIKKAEFVVSSKHVSGCPKPDRPEYAFIGRSNVGKSSLINMLTNRKGLAKTSGSPGKTQLINHFNIDDQWYMVDLPGYGWAKVGKADKKYWLEMIREYLLKRENLYCIFLLIDIRHEPQRNDLEFMNWMGLNGVPFVIVFTKTDKISAPKVQSNMASYRRSLLKEWESLPDIFLTSSTARQGGNEIIEFIMNLNQNS